MAARNAIVAAGAVCVLGIVCGLIVLEARQPGDITKKIGALVLVVQGHPEAINDIDKAVPPP